MIHKQRDCFTLARRVFLACLLPSFVEFLVKFNEKKRLILNVGEQVMLSDEVEDIRSP